jgi:hypothetical protein
MSPASFDQTTRLFNVEWIAQLGGYIEGGEDSEPGVKVLWIMF